MKKINIGIQMYSVRDDLAKDFEGTLRKVIAWQEQEKTLANIKATRMQKNLTAAACEEKVVALTLDDKRREQQESATAKAQKAVDDIAVQCWLRHKLVE